jgi:uncharacterized membrane protein YcjF (UPF0283 family)
MTDSTAGSHVTPTAIFGAHRSGDTRIGRPPQIPGSLSNLTPEELEAFEAHWQVTGPSVSSKPTAAAKLSWLPTLLVSGLLAGTASVLVLYILTSLAQISLLPIWSQYVAYLAICTLAIVVLVPISRLAFLYSRLNRVRQVTINDLSQRREIRRTVKDEPRAAVRHLQDYLRDYPNPSTMDMGQPLTSDEEQPLTRFRRRRDELMSSFDGNYDNWLRRFRDEFQVPFLDAWALTRIKRHAKLTALKTAISPNGLVDSLIVVFYAFNMVGDLCRIYNVRTDRLSTAILLARIFFTAYVAGRMDDAEEVISDSLDSFWDVSAWQSEFGGSLANVAVQVCSRVTAKAAAGFANYVMLRRLGVHAMRALQPTRP